jgi:hypothetical protein
VRSPASATARPAVALALAVLLVAPLAAPATGATGSPERSIDACTTIEQPGTYVLSTDLEGGDGPCIAVRAPDVTLDGNGHAVAAGSGTGVAVGSDRGELANVTVADLRIGGGTDGLVAAGVGRIDVVNVTAVGQSRDGIAVTDADTVAVADTVVRGSGRYGVYVDADGRTTVGDVLVTGTRHEGIELLGDGDATLDGVRVENVRGDAFDEPYDAVFVNVEGNVTVEDTTVRNVPEGRGIYVYASLGDGRVRLDGVSVRGTRGRGLRLASYGETTLQVADASVGGGGAAALWANAFADVAVRTSTLRGGGETSLRVVGADAVTVADVRACGGAVELGGAERTVRNLDRECPTLADYAGGDGLVGTADLQRAIRDWATGAVGTDLLTRVIRAWATGTAVTGTTPGA